MNPRQRRGLLLIGVAALGALAVFVAVLSYVGSVSAQVGNRVEVVRLAESVSAYEEVTPEMVTTEEVPERWVAPGTFTDPEQVLGLVASSGYARGMTLQEGMLVSAPSVRTGFREIAMLVDARTGVGGKIRPGDRVDIIATSDFEEQAPKAQVIVENALIIDVGIAEETGRSQSTRDNEPEETVPVTFAVPVEEALRVSFAESFAVEVRLALRGGGDDTSVPPKDQVYRLGSREGS